MRAIDDSSADWIVGLLFHRKAVPTNLTSAIYVLRMVQYNLADEITIIIMIRLDIKTVLSVHKQL